jgi:NADH-quinone oxidoreductase subunit H
MTSSVASNPFLPADTGVANWWEVFKFGRLVAFWMAVIFGLVWAACWVVGVVLPVGIENITAMPMEVRVNVANVCRFLVPLISVMVFIPINAMFMVLQERRLLALFTVRKGPNRVGILGMNWDGMFQTAADAVKLLLKESITPRGADGAMFTLAPIVFFAPSVFGALPLLAAVTAYHPLFQMVNLPTGIFFVLSMSSIPVVGIVMGAWASNNKYSLVGGLRSAAQAISYEIPLVLSLIVVCMIVGTLDLVQIARFQQSPTGVAEATGGFWLWNVFGGPAVEHAFRSGNPGAMAAAAGLGVSMLILFGIYLIGACAEINRIPFDLPEAESELVSGYNTEYGGIKFAIFFLAEFTNLFIVSTIATVMFLGGGASPIPGFLDANFWNNAAGFLKSFPTPELTFFDPVTFAAVTWGLTKVYTLVFIAVLVRGTLPRFRIDQLMDFGWKRLIPLTLILMLAVSYLKEFV